MKHIFLIMGCVILAIMAIGSAHAGTFKDARPYMAALTVLFAITADKLTNE